MLADLKDPFRSFQEDEAEALYCGLSECALLSLDR